MSDLRTRLETTLSGTYRFERELGGGGMSRVFLVEETALGRKVVIKVLSPELAAELSTERFTREIRLAASLQQANIVQVLGTGQVDGLPYYTMPFVEGESLRARLGRGGLSIGEAISVMRDVARALAYAHERGIVHRDIKPDNVLLSGGAAVVTDFGIAKAVNAARTSAGVAMTQGALTQAGTSIGTPAYMAPEQVAGDPNTDARADVYAFGCMAYELLTGRPPFVAAAPHQVLTKHLGEQAQPIGALRSDCPAPLGELIMRCLAKNPSDRPQAATELLRILDQPTTSGSGVGMPAVLLGGRGAMLRALGIYAGAFLAVALVAKAAIVTIGLPDWVYPGALVVMALGLPVILFTGYVHYVARRQAIITNPVTTPGGSVAGSGTMAMLALKASPHVSWRRTATGGAWAVAGFMLLVAGFMTLRALGIGPAGSLLAAGRLDAKEPLLMAAFTSTGDTTLGGVVAEAVRADLTQSSAITLFSPRAVNASLQRMQRKPGTPLDSSLAREVALREGIKGIVTGDVRQLGTSYLITLRLVGADSGQEMASFRAQAAGAEDIIGTISKLTRDLRGKIGESLREVHASPALAQVTTPSLPALRKYVEGVKALEVDGNFPAFESALTEAVALDTGFAMAYRKMALELNNRGGQRARVNALLEKVYANQGRLGELEREIALGGYWMSGPKPDLQKSIGAYERAISLEPKNYIALNNVAIAYQQLRQNDKSLTYSRRTFEADSTPRNAWGNLAIGLSNVGRDAEAQAVIARAEKRFGKDAFWEWQRARIFFHTERYDSSWVHAQRAAQGGAGGSAIFAERGHAVSGSLLRLHGRLRASLVEQRQQRAMATARGNKAAGLDLALDEAEIVGFFREDRAEGSRLLDQALREHPLESIPVQDRPLLRLVMLAYHLDRRELLRSMSKQLEAQLDGSTLPDDKGEVHLGRALVAMADRNFAQAIAEWREADQGQCVNCNHALWGLAFDLAGNPDSAAVHYAEFIKPDGTRPPFVDALYRAGTLKRMGEIAEQKGDAKAASSWYSRFLELWKDADPELQPKVREVRARLQRLQKGQG